MPDLADIQRQHDKYIDSLLADFERELNGIVAGAMARTQAKLQGTLSITDGTIDRTAGNVRALRQLDRIILQEMDKGGFQQVLDELVAQFPGQLPYFQQVLETLSASMKTPLPPVEFGPRDLQVFGAQAAVARDGIEAAMESIAARVKNRVMLSIGGSSFSDLVTTLAESVQRGLPEVVGLAETATSTYYRVIADRGYQIIEAEAPNFLRYRFYGPFDAVTRPFCRHLLEVDKAWTRPQIDEMDNGQIPNVFISGGGWRCRHQWLLAV